MDRGREVDEAGPRERWNDLQKGGEEAFSLSRITLILHMNLISKSVSPMHIVGMLVLRERLHSGVRNPSQCPPTGEESARDLVLSLRDSRT